MKPGRYRIHRNVAAAHFLRQRFRQPDQARPSMPHNSLVRHFPFRPQPTRCSRCGPTARASCRAAPAGSHKTRRSGWSPAPLPIGRLHADRQTVFSDAGIIDQNVDAAELFRCRLPSHSRSTRGTPCPSRRHTPRLRRSNFLRQFPASFSRFRAASTTRCPARGQRFRASLSNSAARAGHQSSLLIIHSHDNGCSDISCHLTICAVSFVRSKKREN